MTHPCISAFAAPDLKWPPAGVASGFGPAANSIDADGCPEPVAPGQAAAFTSAGGRKAHPSRRAACQSCWAKAFRFALSAIWLKST
jgi:hypothetical protein